MSVNRTLLTTLAINNFCNQHLSYLNNTDSVRDTRGKRDLSRTVGFRVHRFSSTLLGLQVVLHSTDKMYATVFLHCIFILYLEYEFHNK